MSYLCISEEEKALNKRVFSSFLVQKNGIFTSDVEKSTLLRKIFLGVCGLFFCNVGRFFADAERLKVKRYLFSDVHFYQFKILLRWLQGVSTEFVLSGKVSKYSEVSNVPHVACNV